MAGMGWNLIGHSWAAELLQQQIASGCMRHAYLFSGPQGVGRRTTALNFAQAINCDSPSSPGVPCGECRPCLQIARMQQADLTITQSESEGDSLKVDQVRDLQRFLSLASYESPYRVALLLRFNEATDGAQNALLKTLEEPNEHVVLLVTADEPENLLPTIASRCEQLRLRPLPLNDLENVLIEKKELEPQKARLIAHIAGGRPGYAIRLVENESLLAARQEWINDLLTLVNGSRRDRLAYSESKSRGRDRMESKKVLREGMAYWLSLWRDVLLSVSGCSAELTNLDFSDGVKTLAARIDEKLAARIVSQLEHSFARLPNANLQLMLDSLLLEWPVLEIFS
jgi:DNA polymerase III subunit delta'